MKAYTDREILDIICAAEREGAELIMQARHVLSERKSGARDVVTEYDRRVQELLVERFSSAVEGARFFCEENDRQDDLNAEHVFIIDPIDGTMNFVRQLNHSCISVGLYVGGRMESAAVYNPYYDELFTAGRGRGAYLNGKRLEMKPVSLQESLVLFGSAIYYRDTVPATVRMVQELFPMTLDFRRGGSAALDLCYVAFGGGDLFFETCLQPWDYAAGSLIVTEAGGIVTALDGNELRLTSPCSVAAGNPINHPQLIEIAQKILEEPDMKGRIK